MMRGPVSFSRAGERKGISNKVGGNRRKQAGGVVGGCGGKQVAQWARKHAAVGRGLAEKRTMEQKGTDQGKGKCWDYEDKHVLDKAGDVITDERPCCSPSSSQQALGHRRKRCTTLKEVARGLQSSGGGDQRRTGKLLHGQVECPHHH